MSKSLMISGIAGSNIVSPYMAIRSVEPNIASVIQAVLGIFCSEVDSSCLSALSFSFGFAITNSSIHYRHTFCARLFTWPYNYLFKSSSRHSFSVYWCDGIIAESLMPWALQQRFGFLCLVFMTKRWRNIQSRHE